MKMTKEQLLHLIEKRTGKLISSKGLYDIRYFIPNDYKLQLLDSLSLQSLVNVVSSGQAIIIPLNSEELNLTSNILVVQLTTRFFGLCNYAIPKLYMSSTKDLVCQTSNIDCLEHFKHNLEIFQDNKKVSFDEMDSTKTAICFSISKVRGNSILLYYVPK